MYNAGVESEVEQEKLKLEIIRFKKITTIVDVTGGLIFFAVLIVAAVAVFFYEINRIFFIIGLVMLGGGLLTTVVFCLTYMKSRNKQLKDLKNKYAGPVSDTDKELARDFALKWGIYIPDMAKWNFDFWSEPDYENFEQTIYKILNEICIGTKIEEDNWFLEMVFDDFNELQSKNELDDRTNEIINTLYEILELIKRNSYTLNLQEKKAINDK